MNGTPTHTELLRYTAKSLQCMWWLLLIDVILQQVQNLSNNTQFDLHAPPSFVELSSTKPMSQDAHMVPTSKHSPITELGMASEQTCIPTMYARRDFSISPTAS